MNSIKLALLAGAAIAVTSAAHADDLSALKAQVETLNARVAAMEAAPAVPAGFSLIALSTGDELFTPGLDDATKAAAQAHLVSVVPTADAPAISQVSWSGEVYAALVSDSENLDGEDSSDLDVISRGKLVVKAATYTSVGEVGASMDIRQRWRDRATFSASSDSGAYFDSAWGYWKATEQLTVGGGKAGTVGKVGYGIDGACTCYTTDNAIAMDPGSRSQMRLSYAAAPIGFDLAIEDGDKNKGGDELSYAGRLTYKTDDYNGSINGWYLDDENNQIGGGVGFSVDMVTLSIGAAMGKTSDDDFTKVSALASVKLSDEIRAEFGAGMTDGDVDNVNTVMGGIYYGPAKQLVIGVEAEYSDNTTDDDQDTTLALVTAYKF